MRRSGRRLRLHVGYLQRIVKLCLIAAHRIGEVAGMVPAELDLKAREWRLPGSRTKNANAHVVPLSDLALEIIKEAAADEGKPQERGAHLEARQWHNLLRYPIAERVALRADDEHTDRSLFEKIAGEFEISRGRSKWEGSATELLKALSALIGEPANKEKTWPKQPNALSGKLRRAAPPLRKIGIHIDFVREGHDSTKVITIKARGQPQGDSKTSPASSANGKNPSEINETNTINAGDPPTIPTATIVGNKPLKK